MSLASHDEYQKAQQSIITELSNLENKSFETKKQYIVRLREVTLPLVMDNFYEGVKKEDLCSFIYEELLKKHGITVSRNDAFYSLFQEDEKHSEKNPLSTKRRQKISSLPIEKQTGDKTIDTLKQYARAEVKQPHDYEYSQYLNRVVDTANQTIKQSESLLSKLGKAYFFVEKFEKTYPNMKDLDSEINSSVGKKKKDLEELRTHYENCNNNIVSIEDGLGDVIALKKELDEILAEQKFNSKQLDERNKITFLEKWNAIVSNISIGVSAVAKKLGVNKKHLTNNVRPKSNPVTHNPNMHHQYIDWFKAIKVVSPDGQEFIFDAKKYFDEQIERGKLNVPFKPLILRNAEIDE